MSKYTQIACLCYFKCILLKPSAVLNVFYVNYFIQVTQCKGSLQQGSEEESHEIVLYQKNKIPLLLVNLHFLMSLCL